MRGDPSSPAFPALSGESNAPLVVKDVTECTGPGETFLSRLRVYEVAHLTDDAHIASFIGYDVAPSSRA